MIECIHRKGHQPYEQKWFSIEGGIKMELKGSKTEANLWKAFEG